MAHYEDLVIDKGSDVYLEIHLGNMDNSRKNLAGDKTAAVKEILSESIASYVSAIFPDTE